MIRDVRLPLGVLLVVVGAACFPRPAAPEGETTLAALGRSAGGLTVLASDVLFLRAAALRREGRPEDVPALYRAVLDLEPDNTAASGFLVEVLAYDLLAEAPDAEARAGWWQAAYDLLARARARSPDDPSLLVREAELLIDVVALHPDLAARADRVAGDHVLAGLRRLLEAAKRTPDLPRLGRWHLQHLAELVPVVAADRLDDDPEPVLRLGDQLLAARVDELGEMRRIDRTPDGELEIAREDELLETAIRALREIVAAAPDHDRDRACRALAPWRRLVPHDPTVARLAASIGC